MSPENQWLEDVFLTEIVPFWGDKFVRFRVSGNPLQLKRLQASWCKNPQVFQRLRKDFFIKKTSLVSWFTLSPIIMEVENGCS